MTNSKRRTFLEEFGFDTNEGICRICRKTDDGYLTNGLCIDCDMGINTGQWVWDKIAANY